MKRAVVSCCIVLLSCLVDVGFCNFWKPPRPSLPPREKKCGANENLVNCPSDCSSDYCPRTESEAELQCENPATCPPPACKCRLNYRRSCNGTCIPTTQCPPFSCQNRPNEVYNACPPYCPSDDCSMARYGGKCPPTLGNILILLNCNPRCRCRSGYYRNQQGFCVPACQCENQNTYYPRYGTY